MGLWSSSFRLGVGLAGVVTLISCGGTAKHKDTPSDIKPMANKASTKLAQGKEAIPAKTTIDLRKLPDTAPPTLGLTASPTPTPIPKGTEVFPSPSLTREAALLRSLQINHVIYSLWFALGADNPDFQGRTTIRFELKPKAHELSKIIPIDFEGGTLHTVNINGNTITDLQNPDRYDGHRLFLNINELTVGANKVDISYSHLYSNNGNGLYRFKDPADNRTYIYSNFEPYNAHLLFPCFDQPNLKATYELTVEAPKDWHIIANTLEREKTPLNGHMSWAFPVTRPFSTYVFALHAGPYALWTQGKSESDKIPIRLFARQSMAKYVDFKEWLKITEEGLDFYEVQFGYPYPFTKYDQVIVPDFNAGAMENVGAVTFSENFIYRTRVTVAERRLRANVILHEMAHMWFGDLVTMRWWNGLWLNESFATFASTWALDKATQFSGVWSSFFASAKQSAYWEDQLVTTHPIELPVADTDHAEANFDGITYGKGASVLKQLSFYLGEDDFREGLQRYFQKYAFRNSTLADFIHMLSEASNEELGKWQQNWIQTQGVNTIKTNWECKVDPDTQDSTLSKFEIIQTAPFEGAPGPNQNTLRPHRTWVAFLNTEKLHKSRTSPLVVAEPPLDVHYSGAITSVPTALGLPCPEMVFPNYQDHDYVKIELDPKSLAAARKGLSKIADPITRQMIWQSLWDMVIDGTLKPQDYADTAIRELANETSPEILTSTLGHLVDPSANKNSILKFLSDPLRKAYHLKLEVFIRSHVISALPGSNEQLIWYYSSLKIASSPNSKKFLTELLNHKQKLRGFAIDQEHRWEIIEVLARMGAADMGAFIDKELEADKTDSGQKNAISAKTLIPTATSKSYWLNRIIQNPPAQAAKPASPLEDTLSLGKLRAAMGSYAIVGQEEFTTAMMPTYFEALPKIVNSGTGIEFAKSFSRSMFPSLCDPEVVERTTKLLDNYPNFPAGIIKTLKMKRQEESRCIQIRKNSLAEG